MSYQASAQTRSTKLLPRKGEYGAVTDGGIVALKLFRPMGVGTSGSSRGDKRSRSDQPLRSSARSLAPSRLTLGDNGVPKT